MRKADDEPTPDSFSLESCQHKFVFDNESGEIICEAGCGWAVRVYERRELVHALPAGRKLTSPSVRNSNLGDDEDLVITDLRKGVVDPATGRRVHLLSGALRFFGNGHSRTDEDLVVELANRLSGRESPDQIAAIAMVFRKELAALEKEKRTRAMTVLDQITRSGQNGS